MIDNKRDTARMAASSEFFRLVEEGNGQMPTNSRHLRSFKLKGIPTIEYLWKASNGWTVNFKVAMIEGVKQRPRVEKVALAYSQHMA